jgi:hypothetical protein
VERLASGVRGPVRASRLRALTLVIIEDSVKSGDWGIGGKGITAERVNDVRSGAAAAPAP